MQKALEPICVALDNLSAAVLAGWAGDQTFQEAWGWHCPVVTRHDYAAIPKRMASKFRDSQGLDLSVISPSLLQDIPRRLGLLQVNTVPQLFGGNCPHASATYIQTLDFVQRELEPVCTWPVIDDPKLLPPGLARRVKSFSARLNQLDPDMDNLEGKVRRINDAHDAAESLPTDMEALIEAREGIKKLASAAQNIHDDIYSRGNESERLLGQLHDRESEASKLVDKCEEAYRITTTKGLAAAFDERASSLKTSMQWWVGGLLAALLIGAFIGSHRVEILSTAVSASDPQWGAVLMHLVLSLLSVGGPLWFSWIATKQIGQRFRLAEDYAFKASVAKAYEGYRKEAARIDEVFEARLFSSALSRLEEAPLRLVEGTTHGSPWHEFMSSPVFKQAVDTVPDFKETLTGLLKQGAESVKGALESAGRLKSVPVEPVEVKAEKA